MKIEIISGSPRITSVTRRVATFLYNELKGTENIELGLIDVREYPLQPPRSVFSSIEQVPNYLVDVASRIFAADGFILVSPEYNGGYSPALKILLDHFPKQSHKVFGIVTASPGALGGIRAALQLQHLVYALYGIGSPHMLIVPEVDKKFSDSGELVDPTFMNTVDTFLNEFLWLAEQITFRHHQDLLRYDTTTLS